MSLYEGLDFARPGRVADGPFKKVVADVPRKFHHEGRDPYLIAEVRAAHPLKVEVRDVYRNYPRGLIAAAYAERVDAETLKALERYGLAR